MFEELSAERFIVEAKARRAECLVFEGRYTEALDVATECRDAAAKSPVGGVEALIERSIGYALHQARRPDEAVPHFEESLRIARELKARVRARADPAGDGVATARPTGPRAESDAILERLGVVSLPAVPLP